MNSDETTFTPEHLDEQIEHPAGWLALDDQRLLQDLQRTCQPYERENAQSLHTVWQRLQQERQKQFMQDTAPTIPLLKLQGKQTMKNRWPLASSASSGIKRTLSLIAAVIVVATLVVSAAILFNVAGQRLAHSNTTFGNTSRPDVAPSAAIYITYTLQNPSRTVLSKLDGQTHKPLWVYQDGLFDAFNTGTPIAYGDAAYLDTMDERTGQAHLIALNTKTGKELWNVAVKATAMKNDGNRNNALLMQVLTAPAVADGHVFVMNRAGTVFSFEAKTGKENWTYETGTSALFTRHYPDTATGQKGSTTSTIYDGSTPFISNGVLYGTLQNTYFAVNAHTGKQLWSSKLTEQYQLLTGIQVVDNVIYTTSYLATNGYNPQAPPPSYVYAFNTRDGSQIWKYLTKNGSIIDTPAVSNGYVYFIESLSSEVLASGRGHATLRVLNAQGHEVWHKDYNNIDGSSSPIVGEGYVSVSVEVHDHTNGKLLSSTLYVYDARSGNGRAKNVVANPIAIQHGVLYTRLDNQIIAYDIKSLQVLWHGQYGVNPADKAGTNNVEIYQVVVMP